MRPDVVREPPRVKLPNRLKVLLAFFTSKVNVLSALALTELFAASKSS